MEIIEILQYEWAIRALIASSMVGVMCGVLGVFIVLRNMSLIGDALSHAILPGVVFGFVVAGYSLIGFFTGAVIAGLIAAVIITWIQQNVKTKNDAAIGIVFTAMFSIGVMKISQISRDDGVHLDLKDFLFGNVLGVSNEDLYLTAFVTVYVLVSVIVFYRYLFATTFQSVIAETMGISVQTVHYYLMLLLSFAVVASLKTVGVILVVAMLITPAATALLLTDKLQRVIFLAGLIGLFSAILGLILAIVLETTPGPAMAVTATGFYLLSVFFAPQRGLLFKAINKRQIRQKVELEDTLKQAFKFQERKELTLKKLSKRLSFSEIKTKGHLRRLKRKGLINIHHSTIVVTGKGIEQASKLVRAHRLWETYLVERMGLTGEQIHEDAEHYEHILTDELIDEMEHHLGYPTVDPHGSPIPQKHISKSLKLSQIGQNQTAIIDEQQSSEHASAKLWQFGLLPNTQIRVISFKNDQLKLRQHSKVIELPIGLAKEISVRKEVKI
jgi:ABC-type Mn2+/Zn2+ transport system permease subunit/Mn-dependent DtxR family transcriptional regulator